MNKRGLYLLGWIAALLCLSGQAGFSQVVVDSKTADFLRNFDQQKIKPAHIDTSYWSVSRELRFETALHSVSKNWYQSDNRSSLRLNMYSLINANYIREYTRWNNTLDLRLGFLWEDAGKLADDARNLSVNQNYLRLETVYGVKLVRRFDFEANAKLVTQIMPSYESNTAKESNKTFMAPGVLDIGLGASYNYSSKRLPTLYISFYPVNNNTTFVLNQRLADAGTSGVTPAVKDDQGNIIQHGKQYKMVWGVRTQFKIKYFILENQKFWASNDFSIFVDYAENPGAGQIDNKFILSYEITKNISLSYNMTLRYYDSDRVTRTDPTTGQSAQYYAGLEMMNDMTISLKFNF